MSAVVKLSDHINDAGVYFNGCYGKFTAKNGRESIVYFRGIDNSGIHLKKYTAKDINNFEISMDQSDRVVFPTVNTGFVNIQSGGLNRSIYIDRKPIRQFSWGLNTNSYVINGIDNDLNTRLGRSPVLFASHEALSGIFDSIYYNPADAIKVLLEGKALSVAIDESISLAFKWGSNNILVYNHLNVVGEYTTDGVILYKEAAHCREAISQYFPLI